MDHCRVAGSRGGNSAWPCLADGLTKVHHKHQQSPFI